MGGIGELVSNCLVRLGDDVGAIVCDAIGFRVFCDVPWSQQVDDSSAVFDCCCCNLVHVRRHVLQQGAVDELLESTLHSGVVTIEETAV